MDRRASLLTFLGGALAAGAVELVGVWTGAPWEPAARFLWAAFLAGPAGILLLRPHLLDDARPWARRLGSALPWLALAGVGVETAHALSAGLSPPSQLLRVVFHLALLALLCGAVALALSRRGLVGRPEGLPFLAVAAVALLPGARPLPMLALVVAQGAALVALAWRGRGVASALPPSRTAAPSAAGACREAFCSHNAYPSTPGSCPVRWGQARGLWEMWDESLRQGARAHEILPHLSDETLIQLLMAAEPARTERDIVATELGNRLVRRRRSLREACEEVADAIEGLQAALAGAPPALLSDDLRAALERAMAARERLLREERAGSDQARAEEREA